MKFKEALILLRRGVPVKLPSWGGYWKWEHGTIMMYCKNGEVLDFRQTKDPMFTLSNIASEDWEVAYQENCTIKVE